MKSIDLNADLGEGQPYDLELLNIVSSASIACGGHAGNEETMASTLVAAKKAGVTTGAHPGFVDKKNFGRLRLDIPINQLADQVIDQVAIISHIANDIGQNISYVKLHGALYNQASQDLDFATKLFSRIKKFDPNLRILALDNSAQITAANSLGIGIIREAYADRAYTSEGQLLPRTKPGAVFVDPKHAVEQAVNIATGSAILTDDQTIIPSNAQSLCLHGDNRAALTLARAVREGLTGAGVRIRPVVV